VSNIRIRRRDLITAFALEEQAKEAGAAGAAPAAPGKPAAAGKAAVGGTKGGSAKKKGR
jgi:hypothetical protein